VGESPLKENLNDSLGFGGFGGTLGGPQVITEGEAGGTDNTHPEKISAAGGFTESGASN
jgi:hypothetical protein